MTQNNTLKQLQTRDDWREILNSHHTDRLYVLGTNISVSCSDFSTLRLGDYTNAFMRGKVCVDYAFYASGPEQLFDFLEKYNFDPQIILSACNKVEFENPYSQVPFEGLRLAKSEKKGVNTFSPLLLDRLKPLKVIPKKWINSHVVRLLANGQFEDLRITTRLTDDYAFDAAYNFGAGSVDTNSMIKKLVESPSGWWFSGTTEDGGELGINCHHFDYRSCTVRLNAPAP
ncbi:hypothetical protein [Microbulbifer epialgicus]|uniref:Uncharacterized protein n=1 Tax=Microbulbifer epialgicus TaxID=393907 RepID=A0ABV4NTN8_9GAMM